MNTQLKERSNGGSHYQAAQKLHWTGRSTKPELGNQYWHQEINLLDWETRANSTLSQQNIDIALLGYVCDAGVQRNLGRVGAKNGPDAFRKRLAQLPFHHELTTVADVGNLMCLNNEMEACQEHLAIVVEDLIKQGTFPIIIGGGHDIAYGHFKGIQQAIKERPNTKIGIVNFDAHFDLRPLENLPNSGTPFNQILSEFGDMVEYFVVGIQQQSNTKELFAIAEEKGVHYLYNYDCCLANIEEVLQQMKRFVDSIDWLYITIDMDGFSSAYAPGVSAPSPMGFTPYFVLRLLRYLLGTNKVISCDIAELNPYFDRDNATANLVARLVDYIVGNKTV